VANDVLTVIHDEAVRDRVDPTLALAIAKIESGVNPHAVGDRGYFVGGRFVADPSGPPTSFGLYMLHENGMLGSLTPAQALNAQTNAHVALTHLYKTEQGHPNVHDPGTLAALSQGPADPKKYADEVNAAFVDLHGRLPGSTDVGGAIAGAAGDAAGAVGGAASSAAGAVWDVAKGAWTIVSSPFELAKNIWDALTSSKTWIRVGLFVGGALLALLGLYRVFGGGSGPAVVPIPV
jgi:hypothetical protein